MLTLAGLPSLEGKNAIQKTTEKPVGAQGDCSEVASFIYYCSPIWERNLRHQLDTREVLRSQTVSELTCPGYATLRRKHSASILSDCRVRVAIAGRALGTKLGALNGHATKMTNW